AEVLDDVPDAEACFQELYTHFSRAEAWRVEPAAAALLADLRRRGLRLGLASNYDARLRTVIAGLPVLAPLEHVLISSEVGWRKPAPEFFAAVCGQVRLPPDEVLYIGDDPENDVAAAGAAGLHARLAVPGWESALTLPTN
ncbi:MAG: HAD-IA family hydrolase, partial [Gemmataceae bacterium]|nr:HAD-IA family hydrolase [Gemmataceae bacterium]